MGVCSCVNIIRRSHSQTRFLIIFYDFFFVHAVVAVVVFVGSSYSFPPTMHTALFFFNCTTCCVRVCCEQHVGKNSPHSPRHPSAVFLSSNCDVCVCVCGGFHVTFPMRQSDFPPNWRCSSVIPHSRHSSPNTHTEIDTGHEQTCSQHRRRENRQARE